MSQALVDTAITHATWMQRCIELALRGAGKVSPNPLVGSVIVGHDGKVLGEGWHRAYGAAHAEKNAVQHVLEQHSSEALRDATLYVNLEPCNHFGKTPPCTDLILEHGIPRVVVGMIDPNPTVRGTGVARLRSAGIEVVEGVCEPLCQRTNEAFSHQLKTGRPLVTLKVAQTLDGRVATRRGHSQWISGRASRERVHHWRATLDAVLVGSGTALADNPSLTVRHVDGRQPWRIVLDRGGSLPPGLKLFTDAFAAKTIAVVSEEAAPPYERSLKQLGGRVLRSKNREGHLDLVGVLQQLGDRHSAYPRVQSLLVEAGPRLATALFERDLVDRLALFVAPKLIGQGVPVLDGLSIDTLDDAFVFAEHQWESVEDDMLFMGYRHRP